MLAVGGELKNTFCIGVDSRFYPSPYVGDLEDLRTVKALQETIHRFQTLLEVEPQVVVCDLHPKYNSTVVAESLGYDASGAASLCTILSWHDGKTVRSRSLEFPLTEPGTERMVRSGAERFCWRIIRILRDLAALHRFYRLVETLLQKRDGVSLFP